MRIRRSTEIMRGASALGYAENSVFNCQIPVVPPSILTYDVTRKPSTSVHTDLRCDTQTIDAVGRMAPFPVGRMKRGTSENPTFHGARVTPRSSRKSVFLTPVMINGISS
ncbi:hypothetical protein [Marinomonas arenicola]|uniref:Uncharacterized protein n=1 Tax=Marinomonas arenicola TaxID=569601 RepID=A0ABU9G193_9GAMM